MKNMEMKIIGLVSGIALSTMAGVANAALITTTFLGDACPGTCVDLASAGYNVSGGAVISPAVTDPNYNKVPGTDTLNQGSVASYNVTSSNMTRPAGAFNPILISGLDNYFEFYWGSVDSYNVIEFLDGLSTIFTYDGTAAAGTASAAGYVLPASQVVNGNTNYNFDGYFTFAGDDQLTFDGVRLSSTEGVAFEVASKVPEPGTLALLGLGLAGLGLRRRKHS